MIRKNKFLISTSGTFKGVKAMKETYNYPNRPRTTEPIKGKIVGVNIKPIKTRMKRVPWLETTVAPVTKWGMYVHIKAEDGYQYDAIWDFDDTAEYMLGMNIRSVRKKHKRSIPSIMNMFYSGCDDFISMIGLDVEVNIRYQTIDEKECPIGIRILTISKDVCACRVPCFPRYFDYKKYDGR